MNENIQCNHLENFHEAQQASRENYLHATIENFNISVKSIIKITFLSFKQIWTYLAPI